MKSVRNHIPGAIGGLESAVFAIFAPVCGLCIWGRLAFGRIHYRQIALHCGWENLPYVPRVYVAGFVCYCLASLLACLLYGRLAILGLPPRLKRRLGLGPRSLLAVRILNVGFLYGLVRLTLWFLFCEFSFPVLKDYVCEFSRLFERQYVPAIQAELRFPRRKRNLVYIVCESLENTFSHPEFYDADLMPELTRLAAENDSFPGCRTVRGAECTVTSLHSGQYAFPCLRMREFGRSSDSGLCPDSTYRCLSLFRLLAANGYQTSFMRGSRMAFAKSHLVYQGVPGIRIHSWENLRDDPEYRRLSHKSEWGVNDRILWKHAKREIEALGRTHRPFALQILTLDTHVPTHYIGDGEQRRFHDYRDAIVLQSQMVAGFVDWLRRQDFSEDTVIAVTGDHLAYPQAIPAARIAETSPDFRRTVYNCFVNSSVRPKSPPDIGRRRTWAVFDMAPTLLEAMGVTWQSHRLGVGTSLYSGEKTWLEKVGVETYEREMRKTSRFYERLR